MIIDLRKIVFTFITADAINRRLIFCDSPVVQMRCRLNLDFYKETITFLYKMLSFTRSTVNIDPYCNYY